VVILGGTMKTTSIEMAVGTFVLIGLAALGYLTIKLGKMELLGENYYRVKARFYSVSGLKTGASVELAGVRIGQVEKISLDTDRFVANITLKIHKGIELSEDVIASVKTSGMIGDKFIKLSPGGSEEILRPGDTITETESALDIEELISKYIFGELKQE
jgi:phospholipid/cholesterol/gamma-HCH transport system substrate-binding protein